MVLFDLVDSISHFFWHYMDETHPYHEERGEEFSDAILKAYQFIDDFLGQLDEKIGPDTDVVLMSDHGFGPIEYMVNLNNFFRERGLLEMKKGPSTLIKQGLRTLGITPTRLVKMAETVGLDFLAFALPKSLRNQIIGAMGDYSDVNWDQTVCYSKGHMGQVHLTEQYKSDPELYREKREEVARELRENLRHPETDEPVISEIYFREEIYEGPYLEDAPDLFLEMMDFRCIAYPLFSGGKDLFIRHIQEGRYANHRMNGIFCGRGPSFEAGNRFTGASIVDLAPTLLYLQDLPVHQNMDGTLLEEALTDERLQDSPPERKDYDLGDEPSDRDFPDDDSAQKEARERLEGLGYLG
jgi:predicted AlkP superfamily phosphohydrolase/phosphomutase